MDSLLLHVCCGPCSIPPVTLLNEEGRHFAILFSNSNIGSAEEYERRFSALKRFADDRKIEVREDTYDPASWEEAISVHAGVFPLITGSCDHDRNLRLRRARCGACYRFRFERLAETAFSLGYGSISTTLSISPYQFTDLLVRELDQAAKRHQVTGDFMDYRPYFTQSVQQSRELGMYRQNYCGCRYSQQEAESERKAYKSMRESGQVQKEGREHG